MVDKLAKFIVRNRDKIGIIFLVCIVFSILLIPSVNINYDLSKYIPDSEKAKIGLNIVSKEFSMQGYARVMINNVSLVEAKEYKSKIESIDGVDMVSWLDDSIDIYRPIEFISDELLSEYYKDGSAIFDVMFEEDEYSLKTNKAISEIIDIIPKDSNVIGSAVDIKNSQDTISSEISKIMIMLVPVVIIILILTTDSYLSPILFMIIIGSSILLNMGTNIIFDNVSFITFSIVAALQLAVSMDYSVFMLHEFESENKDNIDEAMENTIKKSILAIFSSALTTIAGFLALTFMGFTIGKDMGLVFAKGIIFSLLSVIFFMPCLILRFYSKIEKSRHKSFLPNFQKFTKFMGKISYLIIAIVIIIAIPSYIAQKQNSFLYGASSFGGGEGTKAYEDEKIITEKFGRSNPIIILVPNGKYVDEKNLISKLEEMDVVKKIQALSNLVDEGIPDSFVPKDIYNKFKSDNYSRILIYLRTSTESDTAFNSIKQIEGIVQEYFEDDYEITGTIPITMDIKDVVNKDYNTVNMLSIISIMIILLFTFKSLVLPILLTLVIEIGISINMAIPYYTGTSMMFMGYLIVSSIELGATIDYAILMTNNYLNGRKDNNKKEAANLAINKSLPSIITSGGILVCAAYLIKIGSSNKVVSEMGHLIGRGALISIFLVLLFLPYILIIFDKLIQKTNFSNIFKSRKEVK